MTSRARCAALLAILAVSAAVRLHHVSRPMADSLLAKQAYVANRARSIAAPPLNPLRSSLDFLDANGERMNFTDEVPTYHTMLAIGYRLAGERDWVGHAISVVGTIVALIAFFALARREWSDREALSATVIFSAAPIFVFYGRAVLPEPWMLAMMLTSAASYRRFLDGDGRRWLLLASLAALGAGFFKYFGLIVFVPLAEMAWRKHGSWRAVFSRSFLGMLAVATVPMAAWMGLVFFRGANPIQSGWVDGQALPYFSFQAPSSLVDRAFYANFFGRFFARDCGPIAATLIVVGIVSTLRRGRVHDAPEAGMVRGWTVMALGYYALLAPKLRDHDYYELMMLPAAALWATRGLKVLATRFADRFSRVPLAVLDQCSPDRTTHWSSTTSGTRPLAMTALRLLVVVVQSPWIMGGFFAQDEGKLALADRLRALCPPGERVVTIGPGIEFPTVIHYSHREGWPVSSKTLPENWRDRLEGYRDAGATLVGVYFEPKATKVQRDSYAPLLREFPEIERQTGLRSRSGGPGEFVILGMGKTRPKH